MTTTHILHTTSKPRTASSGRTSRTGQIAKKPNTTPQGHVALDYYEVAVNADWKFVRFEGDEIPALEAHDFDDSSWDTVALPHTPHIEKFDEPFPWQGICAYRLSLDWSDAWDGKCVSLKFGAAMQIADVWINGCPYVSASWRLPAIHCQSQRTVAGRTRDHWGAPRQSRHRSRAARKADQGP